MARSLNNTLEYDAIEIDAARHDQRMREVEGMMDEWGVNLPRDAFQLRDAAFKRRRLKRRWGPNRRQWPELRGLSRTDQRRIQMQERRRQFIALGLTAKGTVPVRQKTKIVFQNL